MKKRKIQSVLMGFAMLSLLFASCSKDNEEQDIPDINDPNFVPNFMYDLSGSGLTYEPTHKTFSYTFYIKNTGNIGIILDIDYAKTISIDDVFEIGIFTPNLDFINYPKTLQKNEFRFGEAKTGHEIAPNASISIEVIGIVDELIDDRPPTTVRIHYLYITDRNLKFRDDIDYYL
jgi:hypothetical protein